MSTLLMTGLGGAPTAQAAPVVRNDSLIQSITCTIQTADGVVVLEATSFNGSPSGELLVFEGKGEDERLVLSGTTTALNFDDNGVRIEFATEDLDQVTGTATFQAERTLAGAPRTEQLHIKVGNELHRGTQTISNFTVSSAILDLAGTELTTGAGDCESEDLDFDVRTNAAASQVRSYREFDSPFCELGNISGEVNLRGTSRSQMTVDLVVYRDDVMLTGSGEVTLRAGSATASISIFGPATEEQVDTAEVRVELTPDGRLTRQTFTEGPFTERVLTKPFAAAITVTTENGDSAEVVCSSEERSIMTINRPGAET